MAEIYDLRKARRRTQSPPFIMPDSWLTVANMFGFEVHKRFSRFALRRTRNRGTEVYIREGRFSMNLSYFAKTYPPNFTQARIWISSVADRYGWELTEEPYRRF